MNTIIENFNNIDPLSKNIIILFCILIVGFFIYKTVVCWRIIKVSKDIKSAIERLPAFDHRNEFAKNYKLINEEFSQETNVLSHLWQEFTEQLVEPRGKENVFQNSIRPETFFTLDPLLKEKNINLKLIESTPGILVGLGVLGTFFGLTVSLIQTSPNLTGPNPNLKVAIETLISGSGVAFLSSVVGLSCSLVFNVVSDKTMSSLQNNLNKFNSLLEKSLKFITKEYLSTKHLEELSQQNKYLENMDETLALKIGDLMEEKIGNKVQEAISQSTQNISNIARQITHIMEDFSNKQMRNSDKNLSVFTENIPSLLSKFENSFESSQEKTKNLIDDLAISGKNNQAQINNSLIDFTKNIKSEFGEMISSLKQGIGQTLSQSSGELTNHIGSLGDINQKLHRQINESQIALDKTTKNLHSFADRLENSISEVNNTAVENIKNVFDNFHKTNELQKQIVTENQAYIQSLNPLTESLKLLPPSLSENNQAFSENITKINDSNKYLKSIWENYEERFKNVDESTKQLFINVNEGLRGVAKESASHIQNLYQQISQISGVFTEDLDIFEELKDALEELKNTIEKQNYPHKKIS